MSGQLITIGLAILPLLLLAILVSRILSLRRIVPTNVVHIVQQGKKTISYGVGKQSNVYYKWPIWLPILGVEVRELPVSNFDVDLNAYEAYDKDRLQFVVDVKAFFRIDDTNKAAEKVESFKELKEQLTNVVRGSVRSILAKEPLMHIMEERSIFGDKFTNDVNKDLLNWGVVAIKNIELMDIRDAKDSKVIHQIMAKQMSAIESESRIAVSNNKKTATEAELENEKEVNLKTAQTRQLSEKATAEADQAIGIAQAESKKMSGIADQKSLAEVAEAKKATTEKEMEVMRIKQITQAEITKKSAEILAEQNKRTAAITAEANKLVVETNAEATLLANQKIAEGNLILKQKEAEGIKATGLADADIIAARGISESEAKKLMELASVVAQTTFAKELGENKPYQEYLVELKKIDATAQVEIKRAESLAIALNKANLKLLVNSGDVNSGLNKFSDLFSSKGASQFNGILETLEQTEGGTKLADMLKGFLGSKTKALNS